MKKRQISKQLAEQIRLFFEEYGMAMDAWHAAGKRLIRMREMCADIYDILIEQNPTLTRRTLKWIERAGRNPAVAPLLVDESYAAAKLLKLPDEALDRAISAPVPVVSQIPGDGFTVKNKTPKEMSNAELDQVFTPKGIRSEAEQQAAIADAAKAAERAKLRYEVRADGIEFHAKTFFSWANLEQILSREKAKAIQRLPQDIRNIQLRPRA